MYHQHARNLIYIYPTSITRVQQGTPLKQQQYDLKLQHPCLSKEEGPDCHTHSSISSALVPSLAPGGRR